MLTLEEMNQAMSQVKDNLVVQGQLVAGADEDREQLRIMQ